MVVVFNPKQGGFQSKAPTNPIQGAIDKGQADKPQPQVPQPAPKTRTGGGRSERNPVTGQGQYNLGDGVVVPVNQETTKAVQSGASKGEVILAAAKSNTSLGAGADFGVPYQGKEQAVGSYGSLVVSQSEADKFRTKGGGYVPYYVSQAKTPQQAAIEGSLLGETSLYSVGQDIFNPEFTQSQFEINQATLGKTRDVAKEIFAFQELPSTFQGATGTSTKEGISYSLSSDYFDKKFFSPEADIKYKREARSEFVNLPYGTRGSMKTAGEFVAAGKAVVGTIEFGGSLIKSGSTYLREQGFGTVPKGSSPFAIPKWESYKVKGTEGLMAIPTLPSIYETKNIPVITSLTGVGLPKASEFGGYINEVRNTPEKVINVASLAYLGSAGIKGLSTAKAIYSGERAAGASRLGALNVLGGETAVGLSPVKIRGRIFTAESGLNPFKTTQINKGDLLTTTKIGEANGRQLFTAGEKGMTTYTPTKVDYLIYKPKLVGEQFTQGTFNVGETQVTTLGKNVFAAKDIGGGAFEIKGQGTRYVDVAGQRVVQTGRYSLGTEPYLGKYTQKFTTYGQSKAANVLGKELDLSVSKSRFQTIRGQEYIGGKYSEFGVKAGGPQTAKSFDVYKKSSTIETDLAKIDYGKSFGKSTSGGRKIVSQFNVRTITPKKNFIDIKTFGTGKKLPSGFKVTRVYSKGEFGYLGGDVTKSLQQININRGLSTSLKGTTSPMKLSIESGLKTELKTSQVRPRIRQENIQKQYESLSPKYKAMGLVSVGIGTGVGLDSSTRQGISVYQIQPVIQTGGSKQIQTQEFKIPSSPSIPSPTSFGKGFDIVRPRTPVPFIIPSLGLPDYTPAGRRTRSQKKKRQVSLYSAIFGVKTSKASPLDITGITQRDIVTGKRRKR